MANPTTNFGWVMPTSTDLVTDLPADFAVFGQAVDTSMADLKGGTTGQVLSKTSATDMDFTWVTTDDANAIQNTIVDAKGDLIGATAADTPARLAVGTNGQVLTADSTAATGLAWATASSGATSLGYAAGKNAIINGAFNVWQRGTSFTIASNVTTFTADRFYVLSTHSSGTTTASQQTFTPGTAPVAGYEGQYFHRITNSAATTNTEFQQRIEDVRSFAGQTVTISFWAKASSTVTMGNTIVQNFGSGGSGNVGTTGANQTFTTSWARYSITINVPSISGKTIGTNSYLQVYPFYYSSGTIASNVIDIWGLQVEAGSTATAFQTATGTLQGELAACQRYYYRFVPFAGSGGNYYGPYAVGGATSTTNAYVTGHLPVALRTAPTFNRSGSQIYNSASNIAVTALSNAWATGTSFSINVTVASGLTAGQVCHFAANNNSADYFDLSAEL
jgi:hypothetical protein